MAAIEATLSTTASTTRAVPGWKIGWGENHDKSPMRVTAGCVQAVRVAMTGDYEVLLQGGIPKGDGTITWSTVATITQAENGNLITFTVAPGASYRFSHSSGVNVVCAVELREAGMPGSRNATAAAHDIDAAAQKDPSLHRALSYLLEQVGQNTADIANFSSYTPFLGVGYFYDDDTIAVNNSFAPDITFSSGEGVALEQFTTTGTPAGTYTGFSLSPGTYYIAATATIAATGTDLYLRQHTAFPSTGAAISTAGSSLESIAGTFGVDYLAAMLTATAVTKVWAYVGGGGASSATMWVHRLV